MVTYFLSTNGHCRFRVVAVTVLIALTPVLAVLWPLDALQISLAAPEMSDETPVLHAPVLLGQTVRNTIIHSVQLTPVIDTYHIQEGSIWAWEERIMSHNAGLPSLKPKRGRFLYDSPWMIVQGGGQSWKTLYYRVGTETFGKNELCIFPRPCRELWRELPGKRIVFHVVPSRLCHFVFHV